MKNQSGGTISVAAAAAAALYPLKHDDLFQKRKGFFLIQKMKKLGNKAAQGIQKHVTVKLSLGAKLLQVGGMEKVFRQLFPVCAEETLLKASLCYLSTTSGPIAGLFFVSNQHIAFCSNRSLKVSCPNGASLRVHYKVLIPLEKIEVCNESKNMKLPSEKYMQIVTVDSFEFWFIGFLKYKKTWRYLHQLILKKDSGESS